MEDQSSLATVKHPDDITLVILAGGLASRMGGLDKGLECLADKPLVLWVVENLGAFSWPPVISCNRHMSAYERYGLPVVDQLGEYAGPLAGICATLKKVRTEYALIVPCDTPLVNQQLVERLWQASLQYHQESLWVAHDGQRLQHLHLLMRTKLLDHLGYFLSLGERKVWRWLEAVGYRAVDFSDLDGLFVNINRIEDLQVLEQQVVD